MSQNNLVLLSDLANELSLDRSNLRRYVIKNSFKPLKVRTSTTRGQLALAFTQEDAEAIRKLRQSQGYVTKHRAIGEPIIDNGNGWFYIIQLVPKLDKGRVKLGFANNVAARLSAHRTAAPTAQILKTWSCNRNWERAVIASITRKDCKPLSNEVFVTNDLNALVKRGEEFFSIMPIQSF